jgi:hypothetical protein
LRRFALRRQDYFLDTFATASQRHTPSRQPIRHGIRQVTPPRLRWLFSPYDTFRCVSLFSASYKDIFAFWPVFRFLRRYFLPPHTLSLQPRMITPRHATEYLYGHD